MHHDAITLTHAPIDSRETPNGTVKVGGVDITRFDPHDLDFDLADRLAEIETAALSGTGWAPRTGDMLRLLFTNSNDFESGSGIWVAAIRGRIVAWSALLLPHGGSIGPSDFARLEGAVEPGWQNRGIGRALLETVSDANDRSRLRARCLRGTPSEHALPACGFDAIDEFEIRRFELDLPLNDWLRSECEAASEEYSIERFTGAVPERMLDEVRTLREAINDAPGHTEVEAFARERIRREESSLAHRRITPYTLIARDRDGTSAGITRTLVPELRPSLASQADTAVVPDHRGHRLGLRLKVTMADWLRELRPEVAALDTFNSPDNHHMIAINERLGYRQIGAVRVMERIS